MLFALFNGMFSGLVVTTALQPFDVIKTTLQGHRLLLLNGATTTAAAATNSSITPSTTLAGTYRNVVNAEGYQGLYKGLTPTVFRGTIGPGIYFVTVSSPYLPWNRAPMKHEL